MKRYRMSVCKGSSCREAGSDAVHVAAREALAARGLQTRCELYRGGCYGFCHMGPNVVVREDTGRKRDPLSPEDYQLMGWPGEVYYSGMTAEKMLRVVGEHIQDDAPVKELFGQPDSGDDD
ncbi:(2Fe-2S) ferredoxin domain-containing protein [Corallococcus praedator]|uniref:(2Fe-2S) ferredoxin domain-containing protein n=1 Tax=Corallococcus praedator TaxID=2316724 RepID=A0ABX9QNW8_9BACT|nr:MULTISPECIES: (2Fe-2S) ferredoxin domain-containing protein [Corallococcus]RKH33814.1 (2Fe-2S) ferredoxin domain-containing protein [Corallococcus sp. CA031C]RKI15104.1 (2Fe-2S) ferredoxin domain-containing protein [Corallococcus praedator]